MKKSKPVFAASQAKFSARQTNGVLRRATKFTYHFKAASRTKTNEEAHWKPITKIKRAACELVNWLHLVFALSPARRKLSLVMTFNLLPMRIFVW